MSNLKACIIVKYFKLQSFGFEEELEMTYILMISVVLKVSDSLYEMITVPLIVNTRWMRPTDKD
jgi:hypothetical protein